MNKAATLAAIPLHVLPHHRLAAKLLLETLARWQAGALLIVLPDGRILELGCRDGTDPVTLTVKDWRFFWRVLTAGDVGAGESYMAGEWECSDLPELCRLFLRDQSIIEGTTVWTLPARLHHAWLSLSRRNTLAGSRRNIRYHYDLSNDLYRLFLDESMTYSCAVFARPDAGLEEAQRVKIDQICQRLQLSPGQHVLEIGSGWGAFAMHAAREYGARVTGVTLSEEQLALARQRVAAAGLAPAVDMHLCDYRQVTGSFDRIVSIEMFEAVGYEHYAAFFAACSRLLKPRGFMFLQTISIPDQRFDRYRREFDWVKKYIFPGGLLASLHGITSALKLHTDLRIEWMQEIGQHYVQTLRHWRERFMSRLPEVRQLGFDDRFIRMWEFYLASCEAAFSVRNIGDLQMVLAKPAAGA